MAQGVPIEVKRINRMEAEGGTQAFCDVALGGTFLVKGVRVVAGKKGLFVSMPQEQGKDGNWYDTVLPLTKEARQRISETVLAAFKAPAP